LGAYRIPLETGLLIPSVKSAYRNVGYLCIVAQHGRFLMHQVEIERQGFAIIPDVVSEASISVLLERLSGTNLRRSRAGIRHALQHPAVMEIAQDPQLLDIARGTLGSEATPFRATLFDKSPLSNWLVVWHQDTALPLRKRFEAEGWGPWSVKDGILYAHAPASALDRALALRVHLDDSTVENGPLRVLPQTHKLGVLSDNAIHDLASRLKPVDCVVPKRGIVAMRPLIAHASSKSLSDKARRVLHIEYASSWIIEDCFELAVA
jgi:ectoine hydroxylase-related dioxygenase (phytanoyl-CoA dioxygenase family)